MRRLLIAVTAGLIPSTVYAQSVEGLRDIKGPLTVPAPVWPQALLFVVLLAAAGAGMHFRRRRKAEGGPEASASEKALRQLVERRTENPGSPEEARAWFAGLEEILRRYVGERFRIRAPEMTTPEFLHSLKTAPELQGVDRSALQKFLAISEVVKFARHNPAAGEMEEGFNAVRTFIQQTREPERGNP